MTMLVQELEGAVGGYLRHECSLDDVREWLLDHVQQVLDSSDPQLASLDGELWRLIAELDRRDRDEASVRAELERLLRARGVAVPPPPAAAAPLKPSRA